MHLMAQANAAHARKAPLTYPKLKIRNESPGFSVSHAWQGGNLAMDSCFWQVMRGYVAVMKPSIHIWLMSCSV